MNKAERKPLHVLLKKASDVFSNHGCNDFDVVAEAGLTEEENEELRRNLVVWSGDDEFLTDGDNTYHYDWMLMDYLADRINDDTE